MSELLGRAALAIAIGIALAKAIDILLSQRQKMWLHDQIIRLWNWFDDQSSLPYLKSLGDYSFQIRVALLAQVLGSLVFTVFLLVLSDFDLLDFASHQPGVMLFIGMGCSIAAGSFLILPTLLHWASKGRTPLRFFLRLAPVAALFAAAGYQTAVIIAMNYVRYDEGQALPALLNMMIAFLLDHFLALASLLTLNAALVAFFYTGSMLLKGLTVVLARIAEHREGPVLAISALLGLVGAFVELYLKSSP